MAKSKRKLPNTDAIILGARLKRGDKDAWAEMKALLKQHCGVVLKLCTDQKIPHRTFMRWREKMPRLEKMVAAARKAAPGPKKISVKEVTRRRNAGETYEAIARDLGTTARRISEISRSVHVTA